MMKESLILTIYFAIVIGLIYMLTDGLQRDNIDNYWQNELKNITGHFGGIPSIGNIRPTCGYPALPPDYYITLPDENAQLLK